MRIPRIVYHTAKRFAHLALWAIMGVAVGYLVPIWLDFVDQYLGNIWYGVAFIAIAVILFFSYLMAKLDTEREKRVQARIFSELSKD